MLVFQGGSARGVLGVPRLLFGIFMEYFQTENMIQSSNFKVTNIQENELVENSKKDQQSMIWKISYNKYFNIVSLDFYNLFSLL